MKTIKFKTLRAGEDLEWEAVEVNGYKHIFKIGETVFELGVYFDGDYWFAVLLECGVSIGTRTRTMSRAIDSAEEEIEDNGVEKVNKFIKLVNENHGHLFKKKSKGKQNENNNNIKF